MRFLDLWWVLDSDLPFWVNDGENCMYYPKKDDVKTATWRVDYADRRVKYVTLDGEGVMTIELWEI